MIVLYVSSVFCSRHVRACVYSSVHAVIWFKFSRALLSKYLMYVVMLKCTTLVGDREAAHQTYKITPRVQACLHQLSAKSYYRQIAVVRLAQSPKMASN